MRFFLALFILLISLAPPAQAGKVSRLEAEEQTHYFALRWFMSEEQEKEYLKLKTREERDAWLKEHASAKQAVGIKRSFWEQYYDYEPDVREVMAGGEVQKGFTEEQVYMTLGAPYRRGRLTKRTATRSELFTYRFEVDKDGATYVWRPKSKKSYNAVNMYREEIYIDDNIVTDIKRLDGW